MQNRLSISFRIEENPPKESKKAADKESARQRLASDLPAAPTRDMFKPVAELITPDPPDWLARHLWSWAPCMRMGYAVELLQPKRAEMVRVLRKVKEAAALLERALAAPSVVEFLNEGGSEPLDAPSKFQMVLGELRIRADRALKLPSLVNAKGKARAGRGPALPDAAIPTQIYYAIFISEAWKWFHGEYPAPRNERAAKAIDLYWELSGGIRQSWGSAPWKAWRHHLKVAAKTPAEQDRAEFRRHMNEDVRHAEYFKTGVMPP